MRRSALQIEAVPSKTPRNLPSLPAIRVEVARDRSADARATGGFLDVQRLDLTLSFPDGTRSPSFPYDIATRAAQDGMTWPQYYDGKGWGNKLAGMYGVEGIPFALLIGPERQDHRQRTAR